MNSENWTLGDGQRDWQQRTADPGGPSTTETELAGGRQQQPQLLYLMNVSSIAWFADGTNWNLAIDWLKPVLAEQRSLLELAGSNRLGPAAGWKTVKREFPSTAQPSSDMILNDITQSAVVMNVTDDLILTSDWWPTDPLNSSPMAWSDGDRPSKNDEWPDDANGVMTGGQWLW